MIQIKNLSVFYQGKEGTTQVLNQLDFTMNRDEICAIIGPSGCGKSTLLKVLSGIITTHEGEVLLNQEVLNPHSHKIGLIPQNFGLLPWKTVQENCLLSFKIKKEKITSSTLEKMDQMMRRLNIDHLKKRYPHELSGGQKQRVAIVRSYLMEPDLLLMDEAFSALDAIITEEAQQLFLDVWSESKINTFFVTHSIDEALYMGKKIMVLSNNPGQIVKIIDNPLFHLTDYRNHSDYPHLYAHLKQLIKKGWIEES